MNIATVLMAIRGELPRDRGLPEYVAVIWN